MRRGKEKVVVYVMGAHWMDKGGYAVTMMFTRGDSKHIKRYVCETSYVDTTENRMVIRAILWALKNLKPGFSVEIVSDNEYCVNVINKWLRSWVYHGDLKSKKNRYLWLKVWEEMERLHPKRFRKQVWAKRIRVNNYPVAKMTMEKAEEGRRNIDAVVCKKAG